MKTSEFIGKALEINGVESFENDRYIKLRNISGGIIAIVGTKETHVLITDYRGFDILSINSKRQLFSLLVEYAKTPLEEREEPKKYKLKHKLIKVDGYLNYVERKKELIFSTDTEIGGIRVAFTIQEWEVLTEQTWEDLLLQFKAIEV